jgi:5-methylcytosine-specific restriction endonuclease McrA
MVYVLDKRKKPLMPCSQKRARQLLDRGRARVHKRYPFSIRLVDRFQEDSVLQPLTLKIDPGSKTTGIALVREAGPKAEVVSLIELMHRGEEIKKKLKQRAAFRRRRRSANLRYRAPRFNNRRRKKGLLPPSIQHRVDSTLSIVNKLRSFAPATAIAQELVRFDTQLIEKPEISGVEYQQGTLAGYEVREYLFEKWGRTCVYCDAVNVPLNLDHVIPRSKGGSDRVSNLVPACIPCNQNKGAEDIQDFLAKDQSRLGRILKQAKQPLKDAAAVNTTRWTLYSALQLLGLPVSVGTGGRTKFNRQRLFIPKTNALDAVSVGNMDTVVEIRGSKQTTLHITAYGRGAYQRTRLTKRGFPRGYLMRSKSVHGFQTGDQAKAVVPKGKKQGTYLGRVSVRETGSFNLKTSTATVEGISHKHCCLIQLGDGYGYHLVSHFQHFIPCSPLEARRDIGISTLN